MFSSRDRSFFLAALLVALVVLFLNAYWQTVPSPASALPSYASAMQATGASAGSAELLVDEAGTLTVEQVKGRFSAGHGRAVQLNDVMPTPGSHTVWLKLNFPAVKAARTMILGVPQPAVDSVALYRPLDRPFMSVGDEERWQVQRSGNSLPVADWPMQHLYPAFEVELMPNESEASYLRVSHSYPIAISWTLSDSSTFVNQSKQRHLILGMYLGVVLFIALLSGLFWASGQDSIYGLFALHVLVATLAQLALTGLGGEYLWPRFTWWNDRALIALSLAGVTVQNLFVHQLTADRETSSVPWVLPGMTALGSLAVVVSLLLARKQVLPFLVAYYLFSLLVALAVSAGYAWRMPRTGIWVLAATASGVVGSVFPLLHLLSLVTASSATQHGAEVGSAVGIPLFLIALYFRSRAKRDSDNLLGLGDALRARRTITLSSEAVLMKRLHQLQLRQQVNPAAGAVMRVRLGNLSAIRQQYGPEAAFGALRLASACVASMAQKGNTVARYHDGDFVLLLEGSISRKNLTALGQRLIACGLAENALLPPQTVLQFKLSIAEPPFMGNDGASLLRSLAMVLEELAIRPGTALRFLNDKIAPRWTRSVEVSGSGWLA